MQKHRIKCFWPNQRSSSNRDENTNEIVSTAKVNHTTFSPATVRRPKYDRFKCVFCNEPGYAMWRCVDYLKLNIDERLVYIKKNERFTNCLSLHHTYENCD